MEISFLLCNLVMCLCVLMPTLMFFCMIGLFGDKDYAGNSNFDGFITSVLADDGAPLTT